LLNYVDSDREYTILIICVTTTADPSHWWTRLLWTRRTVL